MHAFLQKPVGLILIAAAVVALVAAGLFAGTLPVSGTVSIAGARIGSFDLASSRGVSSAAAMNISGQITCLNSSSPVGVWIDAESSNDGWARISVPVVIGGHSKVNYSYTLNKGGRFKVTVGCGGSSSRWALSLNSGFVAGSNVNFKCNNIHPVLAALGKLVLRVDLTQGVPYATCQRS